MKNKDKHEQRKASHREWYRRNKERVSAYGKIYREKHKEEIRNRRELNREKTLAWGRKHRLGIGRGCKKINGLNKRDWTNHCELCGKIIEKPHYHHWDDNNLSKGIWICIRCHRMVEAYEKGDIIYLKKYLQLKNSLNIKFNKTESKLKDNYKGVCKDGKNIITQN